jgi:integrase
MQPVSRPARRLHAAQVLGLPTLAVRRRYLATNAATGVKLPKKAPRNQQRVYLSAAEVRTLAEAMPRRYRVATRVAAYRGLRAGELWRVAPL